MRESDRTLLGRVLGDGESPAWWGVPIGRIAGCEIRVHLVTLVFVAAALVYAVWNGPGVVFVGTGLAALFVVVLMHEAVRGHVVVRWRRLRPSSITFWPLGAVWECSTEPCHRAEAQGAGLGLLALAAMLGASVVLVGMGLGDWSLLWFNPFSPSGVLSSPSIGSDATLTTVGRLLLWQLYGMSVFVLAANLLPMLPLDGGVLLRGGVDRGEPGVAARIGLITGVVLVAGGMLTFQPIVAAVGLCGGVVCWYAWQAERFVLDPAGVDRWRAVLGADAGADETGETKPPIPADERERIERILAKISEDGMASLTRAERRQLKRATERLRGP